MIVTDGAFHTVDSSDLAFRLCAMALILFAQSFDRTPTRHAGAAAQDGGASPLAASAPDPAATATAIDDLAAWPAAAGR